MAKTMIFMSDGCEEVEGLMVVDLVRRAGIEILMVSLGTDKVITGSHQIRFMADIMFDEADFDACDMIILPGGLQGTENIKNHVGLNEKIKEFSKEGKMLAAICAAPTALGYAGVLDGKKATCYPGMESHFEGKNVTYVNEPAVVDGNVITSRGLGAAIDFSEKIIAHFEGQDAADKVLKAIIAK